MWLGKDPNGAVIYNMYKPHGYIDWRIPLDMLHSLKLGIIIEISMILKLLFYQ